MVVTQRSSSPRSGGRRTSRTRTTCAST
jgi:hypothetical protein